MTDNSLIPSQSPPNFSQQGQFDWVAVARTPISFTLEVLARYGSAGVDAFTVGMARAVCSGFDLKPAAQKRLEQSISKLKTVASFGKIAWFGFGLKHIIDDMLESEQGAAFVALSGCLTACYDTDFASEVFRSICQNKGAPSSLTPSLRQWSTLVRLCAGSLSPSQFPHLLTGFERLLAMHLQDRCCRTPPKSESLASAIIILGNLSKGELRSATFSGGLDCAWIAAMAEWMLCLSVEINASSGDTLYRSKSLSTGEISHVVINIDGPFSGTTSDLTHKTSYIPSGEDLLRSTINIFRPSDAVRLSVPWTNILSASFGQETMLSLLNVPNNAFALLLESSPRFLDGFNRWKIDPSFVKRRDNEYRLEFIEWAMWRLPELRPCIERSTVRLSSPPSNKTTLNDLVECWIIIKNSCSCSQCSSKPSSNSDVCLVILARTVLDYLGRLYMVSIDPSVLPSCNGLRLLYSRIYHSINSKSGGFDHIYPLVYTRQRLELQDTFQILTGQRIPDNGNSRKSAMSANGICMFLGIFLGLNVSPLDIGMIKVIPGHIEFEGSHYEAAIDLIKRHQWFCSPRPLDQKESSVQMIVQHKLHDTKIRVGYQTRDKLVGLCSTLSNVISRRTLFDCTTWCQPRGNNTDNDLPGQQARISDNTSSANSQWLAVVLTRTESGTGCEKHHYTLAAFSRSYPRLYLDTLSDYSPRNVGLVRIKNCSKCLLMYAAETLFDAEVSRDNFANLWKAKGSITIRRLGAAEVKIEPQDMDLEALEGVASITPTGSSARRLPCAVDAEPLFLKLPLEHDPVDWKERKYRPSG